jgi:hypothetical protein
MFSALLLIATVLLSMLVVRIGAIAFEMTGLERDKARFQALSCFSGTGFTTRESEQIVGHPQRRKVASFLMILGNAGIVTVITTLVVSASQQRRLLSLRNVLMIGFGLFLATLLFRSVKFMNWLGPKIRSGLTRTTDIAQTEVIELLRQAEGYCVSRLNVARSSSLVGKTIAASGLRSSDILVLSIERGGHLIPMPTAERVILADDGLICYGPIAAIRRKSKSPEPPPTEVVPAS